MEHTSLYSNALPVIYLTGVAYTSECFACKPGTFSDKPGSSGCQVCPRNTYSEKGAKECTKCKEEMYYAGTSIKRVKQKQGSLSM